jgi:hypothetical protein
MVVGRVQAAEIAAQIGSGLMPDNDQWTNRFTVQSSTSSAVYVVAQRRSDGVWGCSCRGWIHYRHCRHLTDILRRLARLAEQVDAPTFRQPQFTGDKRGGFSQPADKTFNAATLQVLRTARVALLDLDTKQVAVDRSKRVRTRILDLD